MRALGINTDGTKKKLTPTFVSAKKTVDVKDRVVRRKTHDDKSGKAPAKLANDPAFSRYRKENYRATIEEQRKKASERSLELREETVFKTTEEKTAEKLAKRGAVRAPGAKPFKNAKTVGKKKTGGKAPVRRKIAKK
jgi:hypothetical protein